MIIMRVLLRETNKRMLWTVGHNYPFYLNPVACVGPPANFPRLYGSRADSRFCTASGYKNILPRSKIK